MLLIVVYVLGVLLTTAYVVVVNTNVISMAAVFVKSPLHHVRLR